MRESDSFAPHQHLLYVAVLKRTWLCENVCVFVRMAECLLLGQPCECVYKLCVYALDARDMYELCLEETCVLGDNISIIRTLSTSRSIHILGKARTHQIWRLEGHRNWVFGRINRKTNSRLQFDERLLPKNQCFDPSCRIICIFSQ